jgi:hypothetical protein
MCVQTPSALSNLVISIRSVLPRRATSLLATPAGTPLSLPTVRRGGAMPLVFRGSYSGRTPNVKLRCAARRVDRAGVLGQVSAPRTGAMTPTPSASPDSDDDEMAGIGQMRTDANG